MPAASPRVKRVKSGREKKKAKGREKGAKRRERGDWSPPSKPRQLISRYYKRWRCAKTSVHPLLSWRSRLAAKPLSSRRGIRRCPPPCSRLSRFRSRPHLAPAGRPAARSVAPHGARCYLSIVDYTHGVMATAIGARCELHIFEVLEYYFQSYI
jgi:hypothetical protein